MAAEPPADPPADPPAKPRRRRRPAKRTSLAPNPKVATAGLAGAITTIIVIVFNIDDAELSAALTTVIAFLAVYLTPAK
jgi:uncharacterized membrane protein